MLSSVPQRWATEVKQDIPITDYEDPQQMYVYAKAYTFLATAQGRDMLGRLCPWESPDTHFTGG